MTILVATEKGLYRAGEAEALAEGRVVDVGVADDGRWLALVDGALRWEGGPRADLPGPDATCLLPAKGSVFVGTAEAHLVEVTGDGPKAERVASFEDAEGRDGWYTPWGGPPDTRSLSRSPDGTIYVNVHVGGILRGDDGGTRWTPTIDVDSDVHQVLAAGDLLLAATAYGLAWSADRGGAWTFETDGLHGAYSRAVAVAGDWLLVSASSGPHGDQAAVYRRPLAATGGRFERCRTGLPEWFDGNIDTRCLVARGTAAAFGTGDGRLYVSEDGGASWDLAARDLPPITALTLA